jgi:hypothetical protein
MRVFPYADPVGEARPFLALRRGKSMGWLDGRFRRKSRKARPKKEMRPLQLERRENDSGWKVLDAQLLLEHWFHGNGIR